MNLAIGLLATFIKQPVCRPGNPSAESARYSSNEGVFSQLRVYHAPPHKQLIPKALSVALTRRDVDHIAHLARLAVGEEEVADYVAKLSRIIELVDQLKQVDTREVEPMAHPLDMVQRLRPDEITECDQRALFQQNAPCAENGLYLVPRVIE